MCWYDSGVRVKRVLGVAWRKKKEREKKDGKKRKRAEDPGTKQPASQPVSQPTKLVGERREGDADDESLVRSEWERKRERGEKKRSNKMIPCKKDSTLERARASR